MEGEGELERRILGEGERELERRILGEGEGELERGREEGGLRDVLLGELIQSLPDIDIRGY